MIGHLGETSFKETRPLFRTPLPIPQPLVRSAPRKVGEATDKDVRRTGHWYLAEDYAFCHRALLCGFPIIADTTIRLWHVGDYGYSWEDAGIDRLRFADFDFGFEG